MARLATPAGRPGRRIGRAVVACGHCGATAFGAAVLRNVREYAEPSIGSVSVKRVFDVGGAITVAHCCVQVTWRRPLRRREQATDIHGERVDQLPTGVDPCPLPHVAGDVAASSASSGSVAAPTYWTLLVAGCTGDGNNSNPRRRVGTPACRAPGRPTRARPATAGRATPDGPRYTSWYASTQTASWAGSVCVTVHESICWPLFDVARRRASKRWSSPLL